MKRNSENSTRVSVGDAVKIRHFKNTTNNNEDCTLTCITQPFEISKAAFSLLEGARTNDATKVRAALERKIDVNTRNMMDRTALHWAAAEGHVEIVQILIKANAEPNYADKTGLTPLMCAAWYGHYFLVETLINAGADPRIVTRQGLNALHCAAMNGHDQVIEAILTLYKDFEVNVAAQNGLSALHMAAEKGHTKCVGQLLAADCDPEIKTQDKNITPIHLAAAGGHSSVIKKLLRYGVQVDEADLDGTSPLMLAAEFGHVKAVKLLLRKNADPDERNLKRMTALMFAAMNGHSEVVSLLVNHTRDDNVKYHCDLNVQNVDKETALHLAVKHDHREAVKVLVDAKCDLNIVNKLKQTPLHIAVEIGNPDVVDILLTAGAQINLKDSTGKTVLSQAARSNLTGIVDMIIKQDRLTMLCQQNNTPTPAAMSSAPVDAASEDVCDGVQQDVAESVDQQSQQLETNTDESHVASDSENAWCSATVTSPGQDENYYGDVESNNTQLQLEDDVSVAAETDQTSSRRYNVSTLAVIHAADDDDDEDDDDGQTELGCRYVEGADTDIDERKRTTGQHWTTAADSNPTKLDSISMVLSRQPALGNSTDSVGQVTEPSDFVHSINDDDESFPVLEISVQAGVYRVRETITNDSEEQIIREDSKMAEARRLTEDNQQNLDQHRSSNDSASDIRSSQNALTADDVKQLDVTADNDDATVDEDVKSAISRTSSVTTGHHTVSKTDESDSQRNSATDKTKSHVDKNDDNLERFVFESRQMLKWKDEGRKSLEHIISEVIWRLAKKELKEGEWVLLARHWKFTNEHIRAIKQYYTGKQSYKEHAHRLLSIWFQCRMMHYDHTDNCSPLAELIEALHAIGRRKLADSVRVQCTQGSSPTRNKSCSIS